MSGDIYDKSELYFSDDMVIKYFLLLTPFFHLARKFQKGLNFNFKSRKGQLMKYGFYILMTLSFILAAYQVAQNKLEKPLSLSSLRLGMSENEIENVFGSPSAEIRNQAIYILDDGSELSITYRDKHVSSATIKFHKVVKIQDPEMRKLTLVQMATNELDSSNPSWFFAGKPEEGLVYKVTSEGIVQSLTWIPPFSANHNQAKHLQALLIDFKTQRSM